MCQYHEICYIYLFATECHIAKHVWVNIGSGNDILLDGTNPLPDPMLT